jgi:hypothetical protein
MPTEGGGAVATLQLVGELDQRRHHAVVIAWHCPAAARQLAALRVERDRRDLAAADIEADPDHDACNLLTRPRVHGPSTASSTRARRMGKRTLQRPD